MAGLLDFLNSDDAKMGIGLLAAAGPSTVPMNLGQRIQMAQQGVQSGKQDALKLKLLQSQVDENTSQAMLRQATLAQQAKRDAYFMGGATDPSASSANASPAVAGLPGTPGAGMGAGAVGGAPAASGASSAAGGDKFSQWSAQYGIPRDALVNDYMTNGGKGIAEMLMKRGTPDMQVANGYAYDKNKLGAGFMPSFTTTPDGKSVVSRIGPDGMPVVSVPQGALDSFNAYQGAQAGFKPIKVYNPDTKREEFTTEGAVVGATRQPMPMGTAGSSRTEADMRASLAQPDSGNSPRDLMREIATTKAQMNAADGKLGPSDKALLQGHIDNLTTQLKNYHGGAVTAGAGRGAQGTPGYAAGPSSDEAASAAGRQATANSIGGKAGELLKESSDAANSATQSVASAQRMVQALDSDKVLTGPGASLRLKGLQIASTLGMPGKDDAEKIANTRQAVQEMAKLTLEGRKQMSGQGQITNQESALAERATSGSIDDLTAPEIRQLAQAAERAGRWKYAQHEAKMQAMSADPAMAGNVALYKAAPMPEAKAATPVASMRFNPATGKLEKVQ